MEFLIIFKVLSWVRIRIEKAAVGSGSGSSKKRMQIHSPERREVEQLQKFVKMDLEYSIFMHVRYRLPHILPIPSLSLKNTGTTLLFRVDELDRPNITGTLKYKILILFCLLKKNLTLSRSLNYQYRYLILVQIFSFLWLRLPFIVICL